MFGLLLVVCLFSASVIAQPFPNTLLWLDADDASTVNVTGATVSAWRDKSSNSFVAQANAAARPTFLLGGSLNGRNAISFASSSLHLGNPAR